MAYLMDDNAMRICVRTRPWHPTKEQPFLAQDVDQPFFIGNGNLGQAKKPAGVGAIREIVEVIDSRSLDFDRKPERATSRFGGGSKRHKDRRYVFDHVFKMNASQEEVYENTAKPLLDGVLKGYNATVFAYGATGCGKTHTISGSQDDPGIIVRTMRDLYDLIEESSDKYDTHIELSMIELYNEQIRDLLSDAFPQMPTGGLKLLENEKDRVTIADVTIRTPKSADEVMDLVMIGNDRRSTSFTMANSVSSRSHAVLQISVARKSRHTEVDMEQEQVYNDTSFATLSIVDLAGSERASATRNMGARMKEGANINKSLLALSSCISALCDAQRKAARPHVPYRNSKLTRLLKFSLGGNCRTVMIVCVSPSSKDIEDTANTLTWADRAKHVKTTVTRNTNGTHVTARQYLEKIHMLNERVKLLEAQLDSKDQEQSKLVQLKVTEAKDRTADYVKATNASLDNAYEIIREGAEAWAKWDVSEIGIQKLEMRRSDLEEEEDTQDLEKERAMLDAIIAQYKHTYRDSPAVSATVEKGNQTGGAVRQQIEEIESKTFFDVDPVYTQNLKLHMEVCRLKLHEAKAKGAENGYRERVAKHEDALARCAIATVRLEALQAKHADHIAMMCKKGTLDPGVLLQEIQALQKLQAYIFDEMRNIHQHIQRSEAPGPAPVPTPLKGTHLRYNLSPSGLASPKIKRLSQRLSHGYEKKHLNPKPASPRRSLPSRGAIRRTSGAPTTAPARSARFADEVDGGALAEVRTFKPRSSQSPVSEAPTDESGDWEEIAEAKPMGPPSKPKAVSFKPQRLGASRTSTTSTASPTPAAAGPSRVSMPPPPVPSTTASASSASPASATADIPAWKANRVGLGKYEKPERAPSPPKGDTSVSMSISESSFSRVNIPIGLGRPSRPPSSASNVSRPGSVLGELRQLPASARPGSSLGSTLHLPTASSAARANGDKSPLSSGPSPLLSSPSRRRMSAQRHQRTSMHKSAVPYKRKVSLIPSPKGSPNGASPRGSTMGLAKSTGPGAGAPTRTPMTLSMSVAGTSGAGLRTRPSIAALPGAASRNGDTSINAGSKPVWR